MAEGGTREKNAQQSDKPRYPLHRSKPAAGIKSQCTLESGHLISRRAWEMQLGDPSMDKVLGELRSHVIKKDPLQLAPIELRNAQFDCMPHIRGYR
jgi:hypothetical protein